MSIFPILVAQTMARNGVRYSIAHRVQEALEARTDTENMVFWLRLQGRNYADIADELRISKSMVWRMIHGPIRNAVYSVLEAGTFMVSSRL